MNIGLFAGGAVGLEIAKFFGDQQEPLACLAVSNNDPNALTEKIIRAAGVTDPIRIFSGANFGEPAVLNALRALNLDLIILAWWPYILKPELIEIPRLGWLNFHPSYLPYNRGKHYNFWALVEGTPFGVTIHWVDQAVDCGDIAFQRRIETTWEDTGATLYEKAQREIVKLFKDKFHEIKEGAIPRTPQDLHLGSFHYARELEPASRIELDQTYSARALLNLLRARTFPPHPAASFCEDGQSYEVRVEITKVQNHE